MSAAARLLRNITTNYARAGVDGLVIVVLTPFVVHALGAGDYAVWIIVQTLVYYLGFLDLGVADAQVQRHSLLVAQRRTAELGRLHGTVLVFFLAAGCLAVLVALGIAALPSAAVLDIPADARQVFAAVLVIGGFAVLASFAGGAVNGIFEGYQRYDLLNAVDIAVALAEAATILAVLAAGHGLIALALVKLAAEVVRAGAKLGVAWRVFPRSALPELRFDRESWRSIRSFSLWNSLNDVVTEGTAHLDKLLIPILLASALVTPYSLVVLVAAAIFIVAEPITEPFFPLAASRHGKGDTPALRTLLVRGTKLTGVATVPTLIVVLCFGDRILDLWIGAEYTDVAPAVLWFTALNFWLSTYLWTSLAVLMGAGKVKQVFWLSLLEVAIVLALLLVLVRPLGLTGIALAGLIGNALIGVTGIVGGACRLVRAGAAPFVAGTLLLPLAAALPAFALGAWLAAEMEPGSWLELACFAGVTGLVAVAGVVAVNTTRWERARYYVAARRVLPVRVRTG